MADPGVWWREPGRAPEPTPRSGRPALNILVVSPALPYPPVWGFAQRSFQLARHLARHHRVTFISYAKDDQGPDVEGMAEYVHEVVAVVRTPRRGAQRRLSQFGSLFSRTPFHAAGLRSAALQQAVSEAMSGQDFDIVMLESSQLAWLQLPPGTAVIIDEHNIESDLLERMSQSERSLLRRAFSRFEHARYARFEERSWADAAGCAVTSGRDAALLASRNALVPTVVVPNGVDLDYFAPAAERQVPDRLVFTGMLDYRPNFDGIAWFVQEVFPLIREHRPQVELQIVGIGSPAVQDSLRAPGVDVVGRVPDLRVPLDEASVVVVPLRIGGGTRLKVVEAMSMAKPIVSTTLGAEGLELKTGHGIVLADEPAHFADAVCALLDTGQDRERLGAEARALATLHYSWDAATGQLEDLFERVAALQPQPCPERAVVAPIIPGRT